MLMANGAVIRSHKAVYVCVWMRKERKEKGREREHGARSDRTREKDSVAESGQLDRCIRPMQTTEQHRVNWQRRQ